MMQNVPLLAHLRVTIPLFQAPTGSIAGPELAVAVSQAGGLGAMALTWQDPESAVAQVQQVKAKTSRPFLVNYALAFPPRSLPAVLAEGVPVLTFSWGDPTPYLAEAKASGAVVGVQVVNVAGARKMVQAGADFLVCQGVEAGGHVQSTTSLWELLPRILEIAEGVPVVAAGGIGTGAEAARALRMGAQAVMLGTRFVAAEESRAHLNYKQRLVTANAADTALTVCFEGGWTYAAHRVLRNSTFEAWEAAGCPPVGSRPYEGETVGFAANGEAILRYEDTAPRTGMTGEIEAMCLYAGMSCAAIHAIQPAAEIVAELVREMERVLTL